MKFINNNKGAAAIILSMVAVVVTSIMISVVPNTAVELAREVDFHEKRLHYKELAEVFAKRLAAARGLGANYRSGIDYTTEGGTDTNCPGTDANAATGAFDYDYLVNTVVPAGITFTGGHLVFTPKLCMYHDNSDSTGNFVPSGEQSPRCGPKMQKEKTSADENDICIDFQFNTGTGEGTLSVENQYLYFDKKSKSYLMPMKLEKKNLYEKYLIKGIEYIAKIKTKVGSTLPAAYAQRSFHPPEPDQTDWSDVDLQDHAACGDGVNGSDIDAHKAHPLCQWVTLIDENDTGWDNTTTPTVPRAQDPPFQVYTDNNNAVSLKITPCEITDKSDTGNQTADATQCVPIPIGSPDYFAQRILIMGPTFLHAPDPEN